MNNPGCGNVVNRIRSIADEEGVSGARAAAKHKAQAVWWLGYIRDSTGQCDTFIDYIREGARQGGFSLADIGTSEEELEHLRVAGCIHTATDILTYLRKGTSGKKDSFVAAIRNVARHGGFSLADIGTSEEELSLF